MTKRAHINMETKLASALLSLGHIPYEHAKMMTAAQIISLYQFDHGILHVNNGPDEFWNLTPRLIAMHRDKTTTTDIPAAAKSRRIDKANARHAARMAAKITGNPTIEKPKRKIPSRPFPARTAAVGVVVALLCAAPVPADAQRRPTIVMYDGAFQYQPAILRPLSLSGLGSKLEQQGFRVVYDTHLGIFTLDEEPVGYVGHSAGGAAALRAAKRQAEQIKYRPLVITFDAAPAWSGVWHCAVDVCLNFKTLGYPDIQGAKNIPVMATHVGLPFDSYVQSIVLKYTAPLAAAMR